jgi:type II secretory pathway pseudopilin PulG
MFSYIKVIVFAIIAILIAGGLWYVSNMQANLAIAKENQKKLTEAVEMQKEAMEVMKADVAKQQKINDQLAKITENQNRDMKDLENKFRVDSKGEKRSIAEVAIQKPNLMEERVNRGSANAVRCLELASGAPLTEREKNAKNGKEFNAECPSYFIGNNP